VIDHSAEPGVVEASQFTHFAELLEALEELVVDVVGCGVLVCQRGRVEEVAQKQHHAIYFFL